MKNTLNDTQSLSRLIKQAMKDKQITVYKLHKATNVPKQTMYDLINNNTLDQHINYLVAICNALGLKISIENED